MVILVIRYGGFMVRPEQSHKALCLGFSDLWLPSWNPQWFDLWIYDLSGLLENETCAGVWGRGMRNGLKLQFICHPSVHHLSTSLSWFLVVFSPHPFPLPYLLMFLWLSLTLYTRPCTKTTATLLQGSNQIAPVRKERLSTAIARPQWGPGLWHKGRWQSRSR